MRNGTRRRMVALGPDEQVPVELRIGAERIDVWLDDRGIHFRQDDASVSEALLPWDLAIAVSLADHWRRRSSAP